MLGRTTLLSAIWTLFFTSRFHEIVATTQPSFLPQGFFFDWNPPGTTVPIPITQQCDTLAITWERGSTGVGPNPVPPYILQIFTSATTVPIIVPAGAGTSFNFSVPFSPGTQYQICMWDSTGVTGGCQDIYTVIPNPNTTTAVSCSNVTLPTTPLGVNAAVTGGSFSQYGWIPQCTDIQVQPKNGTPPYTLTVAPTLRTPLNITSPNNDPINWTVSLTHGFPFFISLTDSQGYGWTQGPLHSGDNADTSCLNINHSGESGSSSTNLPITIGATVGGVVFGLLAGALGMFALRRRRGSRDSKPREDLIRDSQLIQSQSPREISSAVNPTNLASTGGLEYLVEPFAMPTSSSSMSDPSVPLLPGGNPVSPPADALSASGASEPDQSRRQNIYVVHHDGGRAPVTVYSDEGAEVVELPPRYPDGSTSAPSESEASRDTHRRRDPAATPRKSRGPRSPI